MSNERRDEFAGWAGRLEEPGALTGQGLTDKEAAWDKLHSRLGNPPRKKRIAWYWLAAACLPLILIPAALLFRDRSPAPGQTAGPAIIQPAGHPPAQGSIARHPGTPEPSTRTTIPPPGITTIPDPSAPTPVPEKTATLRQPLPAVPGASAGPAAQEPPSAGSPRTQEIPPPGGHTADLARTIFVSGMTSRSPHSGAWKDLHATRSPRHPARVSADTLFHAQLAISAPPPPILATNLTITPGRPASAKKELTVISINEITSPVEQESSAVSHHPHSGRFRFSFNPGTIRPAVATRDLQRTRITIKLSSQNP